MRTVETQLFQFDELSDAAKETARQWYRAASAQDQFWDSVYDDAVTIAALMGITIDKRSGEAAINFSGFASQGDGACFEGSYAYAKGSARKVRAHAPMDEELHRIARELADVQAKHGYKLAARVKHRGHYSHSRCTEIEVYCASGDLADAATSETVAELLRSFMDWIYRQLEKEHEWRNADEQVDETIRANEYEFEASGRRARA